MLSRINIATRKTGFQGTCLCRKVLATRFYSTKDPSDKGTSPQEVSNDSLFWELPTPKPQKTNNATRQNVIDFRKLLDSVMNSRQIEDNNYIIQGVAPDNSPTDTSRKTGFTNNGKKGPRLRTNSLIEQRLLQMVIQHRRIFKDKAPLPRTMMPGFYGKTTPNNNDDFDKTINKQRSKSLDPSQIDAIRQNKSIQDHDREIKTIDNLLSTKSRHHLLDLFTTSIMDYERKNTFPSYYSRLVKNAIRHAYNDFYDPYLAVALFEQCKTMSITSYIEGCTVDVYNQVLQIRWEAWKDIYGMLDLMEEMTLNGIAFDQVSTSIVQTITDEMEQQEWSWSGGENAEKVRLWSPDDIRSTELMKVLVGKWVFK